MHHMSGVGYAGSHSADLSVGGQPAPLHASFLPVVAVVQRSCDTLTVRLRKDIVFGVNCLMNSMHRPLKLRTDGGQSRVRELGSIDFVM